MKKYKVRITQEPLPKAEMGFYSKGKLTNNAFQFPVTFKEGMEPGLDVKKNLGPVDRNKANIEAERGETIITPMGDDAWTKSIPKTFIIGGKKHSKGGTPLDVPEGSFIFSDHLKERNMKIHEMLGKAAKKSGYTYAELSKPYMLNDDIKMLLDPNSDDLTRKTAQMNIQNKIDKLGLISILQESSKGFTDDEGNVDFPSVGEPYAEKLGLDIEKAIDPFLEAIKAPVQEQGFQQQMQNQMPPMQGMPMTPMQPPMKKGGLVKFANGGGVKKYQKAGTIGSNERVRYNPQTGQYELVNLNNDVIGYISEVGPNRGVKVSRKSIPDDAIILDRSAYKTTEEFDAAKTEAYKNKGNRTVVIKSGNEYKLLGQRPVKAEYKGQDLNSLFAGQKNIALNYEFIQEQFNNQKVKEELAKRARIALNTKGNRGVSMTDAEVRELSKKLENSEFAYQMFLDMQKRNLATIAHQEAGNIKNLKAHQNAANRGEVANQDFYDSWAKVGVKAPTEAEAKMQQALYIGYKDLILDKDAGKIADAELLNAIKPFKISQFGADDPEDISGTRSGSGISIIDGDYTNTTTGEVAAVDIPNEFFEGDLGPDESLISPNQKAQQQYSPGYIPKGWTAPDTWEFARATRERFAPKPPQPWNAMPQTFLPNAFLLSPEDQQNQIRGTMALGLENARAYAPGPAGLTVGSLLNADSLTAQTSAIHNANQQIINAHSANVANLLTSGSTNRSNLSTNLYDKTSNRIEAIRARAAAAAAETVKAYGIGESNDAAYQAGALTHPNYIWDPYKQEYKGFRSSGPFTPSTGSQTTARDLFNQYRNEMKGVSDATVWSIAKADLGIKEPDSNIPDYLKYSLPPDLQI